MNVIALSEKATIREYRIESHREALADRLTALEKLTS
jgi:hypothetical protein